MLEFSDTILAIQLFDLMFFMPKIFTFSSSMMLLAMRSLRTAKRVEWRVMRLTMVMKIARTVSILCARMAPETARQRTNRLTI